MSEKEEKQSDLLVRANAIASAALKGLTGDFVSSREGRALAQMLEGGRCVLFARSNGKGKLDLYMVGPSAECVDAFNTWADRHDGPVRSIDETTVAKADS